MEKAAHWKPAVDWCLLLAAFFFEVLRRPVAAAQPQVHSEQACSLVADFRLTAGLNAASQDSLLLNDDMTFQLNVQRRQWLACSASWHNHAALTSTDMQACKLLSANKEELSMTIHFKCKQSSANPAV